MEKILAASGSRFAVRFLLWLPPSAFAKASAFAMLRRTAVAFGGGWLADRRSFNGGG